MPPQPLAVPARVALPRGAPRLLTAIPHAPQTRNQHRIGLGGSGGIEKHVQALVITHRRDVQLRADGLLLGADIARGVGLELQNGGV